MAAKETLYICGNVVKRYETSLTYEGKSLYFGRPLSNRLWEDTIDFLSKVVADSYNEGVDQIRVDIKEVLGL